MAINYEARVLSSLLRRQDVVSVMGENLNDLLKTHKDIWEFIWNYYQRNRETPSANIVLEEFPDFEYIEDLDGATKHHIDKLRQISQKEEINYLVAKISEAVQKGDDPAKILNAINKKVSEVQRRTGASRVIDVRDTEDAVSNLIRVKELAAAHGGKPGLSFGFKQMDDAYPTGMGPGHFIVGLGWSGLGKTWFCIKLMINAWLQGYSPLIINLEMTPEEMRDRIYFLVSQYSMSDLVRAEIDPDDFRRWAQDFMDGKAEFNIVGMEGFGAFSTNMVRSKIEQFKPDVVLADYLQLFTDSMDSQNETDRMKRTAREFKQLATLTKIPIMVISAVTGKDKKDRANPPSIAQVSYSSEIEYAANLAFAIHTHFDPNTNKAKDTEIVCRKNRHGPLFDFRVKMDLENGTIEEIPEEDQMAAMLEEDEMSFLDE